MKVKLRNLAIIAFIVSTSFIGGAALTRYLSLRSFEEIIWRDESLAVYRNLRLLEHLKNGEYSEMRKTLESYLSAEIALLSAVRRGGKLDPAGIKALDAGLNYMKGAELTNGVFLEAQ
jgi:hypothetical protein